MRLGISGKGKSRGVLAAAVLLIFTVICIFTAVRMHNAFIAAARAYGNDAATTAISRAVYKSFKDTDAEFSSTVTDRNGNMIFDTDTAEVNLINSGLTDGLQEELTRNGTQRIYIPLGAATGIAVLSGTGPKIPIKINPISIINTDVKESFESCGINQVRHSVYIAVEIRMAYSACFLSSTEVVNVSVPVTDTVIVGNTPSYYGTGMGVTAQQ